ncbi:MAG: DUF934 domain-containing protein [Pseudomonadota bacterium]
MPLIKSGAEIADEWVFVSDDADLPDAGSITLSLQRFLSESSDLLLRNEPVGVRLTPDDDPTDLEPWLDRLALIEVEFPKYTDGRGYSHAQLLRRRFGYKSELRAVGHILRDQILYMNRSGFDAFETSRADLSEVLEALGEYPAYYQPAADNEISVLRRRH